MRFLGAVSDCKDTKLLQKIGGASAYEQARLHSACTIFESNSQRQVAGLYIGMSCIRLQRHRTIVV